MAFSISEFNSKIGQHGLAKSNLFFARVNIPRALRDELGEIPISRDLEFFCRSVQLPEMELGTADIQQQGFGAITRRPQSMTFPILPATFMVDSNFGVLKFYHRWMQAVVNYDKSGGNYGSVNNALPFEMGYKSEYASTMDVAVFSQNTNKVEYVYSFSGLYPVSVGNLSVAWENSAEVMALPVGFTYDELKVTGSQQGKVQSNKPPLGTLLKWFSRINSFANSIQSIQNPTNIQDSINNIQNISSMFD